MPLFNWRCRGLALALALGLLSWSEAHAQDASSTTREEVLERAAELTQAGEWDAVAELLEPAYRANPESVEVALLLAIAYFRQDRPDEAEPLFRELAEHPDDEIRDSARLFLGLIARRQGDERRARNLFRDVAGSSSASLGDSAQKLLRPAGGKRFALAASLRSGLDSNVPLVSSETVGPSPTSADANLLVTAAGVSWPLADARLRLFGAGSYRKQARLGDFDYASGRAGGHFEHSLAGLDLGAGYAFEASSLASALLHTGHAADLRARIPGDRFVELAYALRVRSYAPDAYAGYSGDEHRGLAWLGTRVRRGEVAVAALGHGERTQNPDLAGWGAGGRARLEIRTSELRFRAEGEILPRFLGARRDLRAEARASFDYAFTDNLAWLLGGSALSNRSSDPAFQHIKATAYTGLELRL